MTAVPVIAVGAILAFSLALGMSGIAALARHAVQTASGGVSAMLDPELQDDAKEVATRRAGLALLMAVLGLSWRFALAFGAAALVIYAAEALRLGARADVLAFLLRVDVILVTSLVLMAAALLWMRARPNAAPERLNDYSATDRFFHELAFAAPAVLKAASWIEDRTFARSPAAPDQGPVFITSLARGGTTALLNALYDLPGTASHTYRDMPFVTAPILWNRLSGGRRRAVARHPRAHGDGLSIDLDTPEAFEEVIWKLLWPQMYTGDGIRLWQSAQHEPESEMFLSRQMAKVLLARRDQGRLPATAPGRYLSKNNANIARIGFLAETFPDARIVVPFRRPECHVASLIRQHRNFTARHEADDFTRRYMRDIGHFEFGAVHRPILYDPARLAAFDLAEPDYWMCYWISAFRHLGAYRDRCLFVLQDDLRAAPQETMTRLCAAIGAEPGEMRFDRYFRPTPDQAPTDPFDPALMSEATTLYDEIAAWALGPESRANAPQGATSQTSGG
ncbi:Sulfotransferase family protein [Roseivivax lentus]|uniref:Sulfotransferase family protein n=1 Tax=Roseivivax lentus TaxID=633194 RepID=A0A1N7N9L4_9RHOB|nr:sulfotransferase [Roseivivax lentus]SIS94948.1 Sulfotransferase family protein [Roseivivax lentus]